MALLSPTCQRRETLELSSDYYYTSSYCLSFKRPFISLFVNLKGTKNKQHCCSNGAVDVSLIACMVGIERGRETGNSTGMRLQAAVSFAATRAGAPCP